MTMCPSDGSFMFDYFFFGFIIHQAILWAPNIRFERKFVIGIAVRDFEAFKVYS